MNTCTLKQAKPVIETLIAAGIVPFMHSSPAIGKSSLAKQIAEELELKVIDLRLTELDPCDLNGLPNFDDKEGKAKFMPFNTFPVEGDKVPKGYKGWLLLLDEFNSALPSVQASAYKLVLDKQVGQHKLHEKVHIICAGNLDTDNAITNPMSSALISRFAHLYIEINANDWVDWASQNGIHSKIIAFIGFKPSLLYTFDADSDKPYASPRTWQMLSKAFDENNPNTLLTGSLVGEGVAREFHQFLKLFHQLPNHEEVLNKADTYPIPEDLGTRWAIMSLMTSKINKDNVAKTVVFLQRLAPELQICALKQILQTDPTVVVSKPVIDWKLKLSSQIF